MPRKSRLRRERRILSQACSKRRIRRERPALECVGERNAASEILEKRDHAGAADVVEQPARRAFAFRVRHARLIARESFKTAPKLREIDARLCGPEHVR